MIHVLNIIKQKTIFTCYLEKLTIKQIYHLDFFLKLYCVETHRPSFSSLCTL